MEARHTRGRPLPDRGRLRADARHHRHRHRRSCTCSQNLYNPATLGPAISGAFIATFYGVASANIFYLPVGNKLKQISHDEVHARTMIIEGIISIQAGDNPRVVEEKLKTFLAPPEREELVGPTRGREGRGGRGEATGWRARRSDQHEHPDERWLLTYADMITLLMALFMVMFAMALVDQTKFDELKVSLKETFSSPVLTGGKSIMDAGSSKPAEDVKGSDYESITPPIPEYAQGNTDQDAKSASAEDTKQAQQRAAEFRYQQAAEDRQLLEAQRSVQHAIDEAKLGKLAEVKLGTEGLTIRLITDDVLFRLGEWELQAPIKPLLDAITPVLDKLPNEIKVDGHTDALPCPGCPVGNQGLSSLRASAVFEYMVADGFDPLAHNAAAARLGAAASRSTASTARAGRQPARRARSSSAASWRPRRPAEPLAAARPADRREPRRRRLIVPRRRSRLQATGGAADKHCEAGRYHLRA